MKKVIVIVIICICCQLEAHLQTNPSYSKASIWYRSDQIDTSYAYWPDVSGNERHGVSMYPYILSDEEMNFHPVISFRDTLNNYFRVYYDSNVISRLTVIVVFHSSDTLSEAGIWNADTNGTQFTGLTSRQLLRPKHAYTYPVKDRTVPLINTSVQSFPKNRKGIDSSIFYIGKSYLSDTSLSYFDGTIGECLVFNRYLKKAEILEIESYLAIKYGVTLIESNYVNPLDTVIWNYEENKGYSNGIAGIGKDSVFGLEQKQSSSSEAKELTIGAGSLAATNSENSYSLKEGSYLLWGHNNEALSYAALQGNSINNNYPLLGRKWLIETNNISMSDSLLTIVKFKNPDTFNDSSQSCYLVIDRSGTGSFDTSYTEYVLQSYADTSGNVYFQNIYWDSDNSGKDVFTFSYGRMLETAVDTPCVNGQNGGINVTVWGGKSPYSYVLEDTTMGYRETYVGGNECYFDSLITGTYTLEVTDSNNIVLIKEVEVPTWEVLSLNMNNNQSIEEGQSIVLDAESMCKGQAMTYVWESDNGLYSDSSRIEVEKGGIYTLIAIYGNECSVSGKIKIKSKNEESGDDSTEITTSSYYYKIYPNPSTGYYKIEANLIEETGIEIRIYTTTGSFLKEMKDSGKKSYTFDDYIGTPGCYLVNIKTSLGEKNFKLIISK